MELKFQIAITSNRYDAFKIFVLAFNSIPNTFKVIDIHVTKAEKWLNNFYKDSLTLICTSKESYLSNTIYEEQAIYNLKENIIISFDATKSDISIYYNGNANEILDTLISQLKKFKLRTKKSYHIYLLVNGRLGLTTKPLEINKPKLSLKDNYNDDFVAVHQIINERLSKNGNKGLVILHGKPGTGKTSYIRYLVTTIKKNVIFLPPKMASVITNPDLIQILLENQNSILVVEDAENIILDREHKGSSSVTELLNITDGLLSDFLNIQVICSFNTDISKVDAALLRKGRLIAKYEFKDLEVDKANALSKKIGFSKNFTKSTSLASIYNHEENHIEEIKTNNLIGFKTLNCN
jgi:hypothetical protein